MTPTVTPTAPSSGTTAPVRGRVQVEGVIVGAVVVDSAARSSALNRTAIRLATVVILVGALVFGGAVVIHALAKSLLHSASSLFAALLPLIFLVLILKFALFGRIGRKEPRSARGGRGMSALGGASRAGARGIWSLLAGGSRVGSGIDDASAEVHRFRVDTVSGGRVDCELVGELRGPALRQGDSVRVHGRRNRSGVLVARRIEVLTSGSTLTARTALAYALARAGWVILALLLLGVVLVVVHR